MRKALLALLLLFTLDTQAQSLYFPPISGNQWQTLDPTELGWCSDSINALYNLLQQTNTKSFLVLKDGKIVLEKYFDSFTADSFWYWASAGKTLTAFTLGLAAEQHLVDLLSPVSQYLGAGWSSAPPDKEQQITVRNLLTMTSGLNDDVSNPDCTQPACLQYLTDAGARWAYHNAPYTLLHEVIDSAAGNFNILFNNQLRNKIGMNGFWATMDMYNKVYISNTRSMARFGLLLLNKGIWNNDTLLHNETYFNEMTNTSQNLNLSYGYLTWLNGKVSFMIPGSQLVLPGPIIPDAPNDMFMALGKNDQKIHVVPSRGIVVVRMGNAAYADQLVPMVLDKEIWKKLNNMSCTSTTNQVIQTEYHLIKSISQEQLTLSQDAQFRPFIIFNMQGQEVISGAYTSPIDLRTLPQGAYLIWCNGSTRLFSKF